MAGVGSGRNRPRLRLSSPFLYFYEVRPGTARLGGVASGNPAGSISERWGARTAPLGESGMWARVSGRVLGRSLCLRPPPSPSSRSLSATRPSPGGPRACGRREQPRRGLPRPTSRPFPSSAALIGCAAAVSLGKAASHWSRPRVRSLGSGTSST